MTSITLTVTGAKARAVVTGPLTSGMAGLPVAIEYDDSWTGLMKNLVCRCSQWGPDRGETRVILNVGETAAVAHEVMKADMFLYLGIEGYSADGQLVMPTTWAACGKIQWGANAGADPSTDHRLSVWAQLQTQINQVKQNLVTEAQITAAIEAYLEENPVEIPETSQILNLTVETVTVDEDGGDSGAEETVAVTGLSLDLTSYSAKVGDGFYINPVIMPADATNKAVTWHSSATSIATVNSNGYVECIAEGNAVITCTAVDGGFSAVCAVNVAAAESSGEEVTNYTVTNNLTNVSSSNAAVNVTAGASYGAILTAAEGCVLDSVIVTMGGEDITSAAYADGAVSITSVTGNIVITASAAAEVTLSGISATYSGGDVAVGTAVTDLTGIVVTATYSDGSTETVTDYTLSGTIAEGSNTVTVSYGGKTATFTVTGVAESTDGKIQFSTLELLSGAIKAGGEPSSPSAAEYHVVIPYTEGMTVRTLWNTGWSISTYPAIQVVTNDVYSTPDYNTMMEEDGTTKANYSIGGKLPHMVEAILTGYAAGSTVVVNMLIGDADTTAMDASDWLYYIPGGEN